VRLLPIETRFEERTIADFKRNVGRWTTIALDPRTPEQMQEALREVVRVKQVRAEDARVEYGQYKRPLPQVHRISLGHPAVVGNCSLRCSTSCIHAVVGNCSLRCSTSCIHAVVGNCSLRCSTSCIHAVVNPPFEAMSA